MQSINSPAKLTILKIFYLLQQVQTLYKTFMEFSLLLLKTKKFHVIKESLNCFDTFYKHGTNVKTVAKFYCVQCDLGVKVMTQP